MAAAPELADFGGRPVEPRVKHAMAKFGKVVLKEGAYLYHHGSAESHAGKCYSLSFKAWDAENVRGSAAERHVFRLNTDMVLLRGWDALPRDPFGTLRCNLGPVLHQLAPGDFAASYDFEAEKLRDKKREFTRVADVLRRLGVAGWVGTVEKATWGEVVFTGDTHPLTAVASSEQMVQQLRDMEMVSACGRNNAFLQVFSGAAFQEEVNAWYTHMVDLSTSEIAGTTFPSRLREMLVLPAALAPDQACWVKTVFRCLNWAEQSGGDTDSGGDESDESVDASVSATAAVGASGGGSGSAAASFSSTAGDSFGGSSGSVA